MAAPLVGVVGVELHYAISAFLYHEASLLDRAAYTQWLELMSDDVLYVMPVQVTVAAGSNTNVLGAMAHFDEDRYSLGKRVERLRGEYAWTENPPSRTRRFISNVQVSPTKRADEFEVDSYLLLFRSRLDVRAAEWVSAYRRDVLRQSGDRFLIARREITVDESVLRTQNLAIFL
jgi:phthalate 3,4-dioxygenase beta subunit